MPAAKPWDCSGSYLSLPGTEDGVGCWLSIAALATSPVPISSIFLVLVTKELQGNWWGFSKAASALFCSALPQKIQDENLAARTDNLKYKTVFQICCWVEEEKRVWEGRSW